MHVNVLERDVLGAFLWVWVCRVGSGDENRPGLIKLFSKNIRYIHADRVDSFFITIFGAVNDLHDVAGVLGLIQAIENVDTGLVD